MTPSCLSRDQTLSTVFYSVVVSAWVFNTRCCKFKSRMGHVFRNLIFLLHFNKDTFSDSLFDAERVGGGLDALRHF